VSPAYPLRITSSSATLETLSSFALTLAYWTATLSLALFTASFNCGDSSNTLSGATPLPGLVGSVLLVYSLSSPANSPYEPAVAGTMAIWNGALVLRSVVSRFEAARVPDPTVGRVKGTVNAPFTEGAVNVPSR
jgi:hypothetical protein